MQAQHTCWIRQLVSLAILVVMSLSAVYGQVRVGLPSAAPEKSASLEVNSGPYPSGSEYRGLLPPKVALKQSTSAAPITQPATGLLIYNTATVGDVTPGYYYWDGSRWLRFDTSSKGAARIAAGGGLPIPAYLLSQVQGQSITDDHFILVEPGREGLFRYDNTDVTTSDNGGTVLVAASNRRYKRAFTGPVDVRWFGAKGDGITDDRIAIQNAVDSNYPEITFPAGYTFTVSLNPAYTTPEGGTGIGINLASNKTLRVLGTIKLKAESVGNSSVIIANIAPITNVHILGDGMGIIDGNRINVSGSTINACLFKATDCSIEGINAINSSYFGLAFRGVDTIYGRNTIRNCRIDNMASIGIQAEKPVLGIRIEDNTITNCGDNGIDIEGNNASATGYDGVSFGKDIIVTGNTVKNTRSGIFLESVGDALVSNNVIDGVDTVCIYINRITSGSFINRISNNKLKNCPTGFGIRLYNNVGESDITGNYFENLKSSINFHKAVTKVTVGTNSHRGINQFLVEIDTLALSSIKCYVAKQFLLDAPNGSTGYPFVASPISNTANRSNRAYLTRIENGYSLELGDTLSAQLIRKVTNTSPNPNWSNNYSTYFAGRTVIKLASIVANDGDYVSINGRIYYITVLNGEYILKNYLTKLDDDFTTATNGPYPVYVYFKAWMER